MEHLTVLIEAIFFEPKKSFLFCEVGLLRELCVAQVD